MLKTLGRSVYLTQFEEQRASLSAFAAGGAPVFISLHISEEFDAAYCARVQEMCDFLSAQGWRILADVSEKTIRQFGCADLTALAKRLHLWGLRLDYGFSLEEMCALAQQLPVAVNASTTTPEVARQLAAGGGTVIAMHNFYPRPETGLDPEFLRESTAALQAEGLQVYGFIPGDALLRGPLYAGLPTLEAHRTAAPSAAFADLALNYGLDGIFAGDPEVSAREQEYIRHFCTTGELCLPVVQKACSSAPAALYSRAISTGSATSLMPSKFVPLTTRPSRTSRQGMMRLVIIKLPLSQSCTSCTQRARSSAPVYRLLPRIAAAVPICCNSSSSASEEMPPLAVKATPGTSAANCR